MKYAITPSQRGMILHQTVYSSDNSFDLAFLWKLTGEIDQRRLRAVIDHVIGETTAFRTSYSTGPELTAEVHLERPRTEILEIPPHLSETEAERYIQARLRDDIAEGPFNLSSHCQVRCSISDTNSATYVTLHTAHIAGDVYACYEMLDAMSACYDSPESEWTSITEKLREHPGSIPSINPRDATLDTLTQLFSGIDSFSNTGISTGRINGRILGKRTSFTIPTDVLNDVRRSHAYATFGPVAVFYTAYAAMVHRVCATDSFIVGIPMADRTGVKGKAASGFFVNTLPLPLKITPKTKWHELLADVHRGISILQRAKSIYPLTVHHDRVCPQVTDQALDNAVTYYKRELKPSFSGIVSESILVDRATVPYPIMATFADGTESITVELSIATAYQDAGIKDELIAALRCISRNYNGSIICPDYAPSTASPIVEASPYPETIWQRLQVLSKMRPADIAIRDKRAVTYRELVEQARHVADGLNQIGASRYVILNLPKSAESVIAFLGIMASGRICVPVDPATPTARISHIVETLVAADNDSVTAVIEAESMYSIRRLLACRTVSFNDLLKRSTGYFSCGEEHINKVAYVIFTSGSTGHPKGVEVSHSGLLPLFEEAASTMRLTAADTWIWLHSSNFDYSIWEIFCPLVLGATLCIPDERTQSDPVALAEYMADEQISVLCQTPAGLKRFERLVVEKECLFTSLRVLTVGGEAFSARELKPWRILIMSGLNVFNMYGLTENTIVATVLPMDIVPPDSSINYIGFPLKSLDAICLDRYGRKTLPGLAGELHLTGMGLAQGYLGLPEATSQRFQYLRQSDGTVRRWLATGDRCYNTDVGFAYIGRIDNQVQLRGFRIELGDLESTTMLYDTVSAAAAAKINSPEGDYLAIWYVGKAAASDVLDYLRCTLPAYMVPAIVEQRPELPVTSNGKTDIVSLVKGLNDWPTSRLNPDYRRIEQPASLEELICEIWSAVTGHPNVLPTSRLFDIGGTSLDAVEITRRLNDLPHPVTVDVVDLFEHTTPAKLASFIEEQERRENAS